MCLCFRSATTRTIRPPHAPLGTPCCTPSVCNMSHCPCHIAPMSHIAHNLSTGLARPSGHLHHSTLQTIGARAGSMSPYAPDVIHCTQPEHRPCSPLRPPTTLHVANHRRTGRHRQHVAVRPPMSYIAHNLSTGLARLSGHLQHFMLQTIGARAGSMSPYAPRCHTLHTT